jgi:hypothetical protein
MSEPFASNPDLAKQDRKAQYNQALQLLRDYFTDLNIRGKIPKKTTEEFSKTLKKKKATEAVLNKLVEAAAQYVRVGTRISQEDAEKMGRRKADIEYDTLVSKPDARNAAVIDRATSLLTHLKDLQDMLPVKMGQAEAVREKMNEVRTKYEFVQGILPDNFAAKTTFVLPIAKLDRAIADFKLQKAGIDDVITNLDNALRGNDPEKLRATTLAAEKGSQEAQSRIGVGTSRCADAIHEMKFKVDYAAKEAIVFSESGNVEGLKQFGQALDALRGLASPFIEKDPYGVAETLFKVVEFIQTVVLTALKETAIREGVREWEEKHEDAESRDKLNKDQDPEWRDKLNKDQLAIARVLVSRQKDALKLVSQSVSTAVVAALIPTGAASLVNKILTPLATAADSILQAYTSTRMDLAEQALEDKGLIQETMTPKENVAWSKIKQRIDKVFAGFATDLDEALKTGLEKPAENFAKDLNAYLKDHENAKIFAEHAKDFVKDIDEYNHDPGTPGSLIGTFLNVSGGAYSIKADPSAITNEVIKIIVPRLVKAIMQLTKFPDKAQALSGDDLISLIHEIQTTELTSELSARIFKIVPAPSGGEESDEESGTKSSGEDEESDKELGTEIAYGTWEDWLEKAKADYRESKKDTVLVGSWDSDKLDDGDGSSELINVDFETAQYVGPVKAGFAHLKIQAKLEEEKGPQRAVVFVIDFTGELSIGPDELEKLRAKV